MRSSRRRHSPTLCGQEQVQFLEPAICPWDSRSPPTARLPYRPKARHGFVLRIGIARGASDGGPRFRFESARVARKRSRGGAMGLRMERPTSVSMSRPHRAIDRISRRPRSIQQRGLSGRCRPNPGVQFPSLRDAIGARRHERVTWGPRCLGGMAHIAAWLLDQPAR
jgi:hypothetical protein